MPRELTSRREILEAIAAIPALSPLVQKENDTYIHELDLEVIVYGRNYNGKKVGPYTRLFTYDPGEKILQQGDWGGNTLYAVVAGHVDVYEASASIEKIETIREGLIFGEMSVLSGLPRNATVKAAKDQSVRVLEIQRPGLRLLRKFPAFGQMLDRSYRTYGKKNVIDKLATSFSFPQELGSWLKDVSRLRVFGKNHQLVRQRALIESVYLICEGWLRQDRFTEASGLILCPRCNATVPIDQVYCTQCGQKLLPSDFVGKDVCLGLEGISQDQFWPYSLVCTSRVEVLIIPVKVLRENDSLTQSFVEAFSRFVPRAITTTNVSKQSQDRVISTGIVDANNLLVMDMDLCIRCGNCSLACHKIHGRSRLLREGIHVWRRRKMDNRLRQSLLAPAVCMHCKDAECLSGCPTGAISRMTEGQIDIEPKTCIGCADCATQCPYDAISMIPRKPAPSKVESNQQKFKRLFRIRLEPLPERVEETNDLVAIKCNLCAGTSLNPPGAKTAAYSCELNCPTGALARIDPNSYFDEIGPIQGFQQLDKTHALGRNIHIKDTPKRLIHVTSLILLLGFIMTTAWGINRYGLGQTLFGFINMRWLTGLVGLVSMFVVMIYPFRRQIYKKRVGPLRYWLLVHSYAGVLTAFLIFVHGGTDSGELLTSILMWSFDVVIFTGIFGVVIYFLLPRLLTRMEETPLLLDTLLLRRKELENEIAEILHGLPEKSSQLLRKKVLPQFVTIVFLLRQYLKRETSLQLQNTARAACEKLNEEFSPEDMELCQQAAEKAATIVRLNSLIYLHRILKVWLPIHVASTSLMLTLMLVHIFQVTYFLWK